MILGRQLFTSKFAVYLLLCGAGLLLFAAVVEFAPPARFLADPTHAHANTRLTDMTWSEVSLIQANVWYALLLMPVAMIMITVSVFEVIKSSVEYVLSYWSLRRRFDEFFGDHASSAGDKAFVILEPTNVPELLELISPGIGSRMAIPEQNRFFKARDWVNRWDTEGAKAVREIFAQRGYPPPELSHLTAELDAATPFAFSMGLGFTHESLKVVKESCGPWLRISVSESGDRIEIKHQLFNDSVTLFSASKASEGKDFREVLPIDWHLPDWIRTPEKVRDYAIILRHTRKHKDGRQVIFVLGGFTEYGTAAAGKYLAEHWPDLWRKHVKGRAHNGSLGDFMILIEGPSDIKDMRQWKQDPNFPAITPAVLLDPYHIDCEWSRRLASPATV